MMEEYAMLIVYMNKRIVKFLFLFISLSYGQENDHISKSYELLRYRGIDSLEQLLATSIDNSLGYKILFWEIKNLKEGINDSILHKEIMQIKSETLRDSILLNLHLGEYYLEEGKQDKAYHFFTISLRQSKRTKDSLFVCKSLYSLLQLATRNKEIQNLSTDFINEYNNYAYNALEKAYAHYYRNYFKFFKAKTFDPDSLVPEFKLIKEAKSQFCLLEFYQRVGVGYDIYVKNLDSSVTYYNKALNIINKGKGYHYLEERRKGILNNLGCIHYDKEEYSTAISYFKKAFRIPSTQKRLFNDSIILSWHVKSYEKLGKIDSAFFYYKKKDSVSQLLGQLKYAAKIKESYAKYNFIESENDKLVIDKKRIINKTVYTVLALILTAIIFVSVIGYRSLKRRQRLIESQKEVQKQKVETLLKEQELLGIDAMIEGQEIERRRIANDLHDNLGSLLTTLKLYIQNFRIRKNRLDEEYTDLIIKADELLDEAYQEVRKMAHVKNAGVPSKEDLVQAIRNFASKISVANGLVIEVEDFGMNLRLDNSLEISIFRIIQELITNVIKHAEATEVSIQLTHHNDFINIMVEDDGKGFKIEDTEKKEGMGLYSIEKRINHIKGTISIDSSLKHGTTISIDIPIIDTL